MTGEADRIGDHQILLVGLRHEFEYVASLDPSTNEQEQRRIFLKRISKLIREFSPTMVASENEHTNNQEFLQVVGQKLMFIDIPQEERVSKGLHVHRPNSGLALCRCVDGARESHWKRRIDEAAKSQPFSRAMIFVGALHLHRFPSKPQSFVDLLEADGYSVKCIDLTKEEWSKGEWKWNPLRDHRPQSFGRPCYLAMGYEPCPDWEHESE